MALTFGGATTDRIVSKLTAHGTQRSYFIWAYRTGAGGGGNGRMFDKRVSSAQVEVLYADNLNSRIGFNRTFSGGVGDWAITKPNDNEWHNFLVTYDSSDPNNDPIIYLDGVAQTLAVNANSTGTANTNADAYVLGNRENDLARNYAGNLCEFAVWDRILTADEAVALGKGYSPAFFTTNLTEYIPMVRDVVSIKLGKPVVTGTSATPHPKVIYPSN